MSESRRLPRTEHPSGLGYFVGRRFCSTAFDQYYDEDDCLVSVPKLPPDVFTFKYLHSCGKPAFFLAEKPAPGSLAASEGILSVAGEKFGPCQVVMCGACCKPILYLHSKNVVAWKMGKADRLRLLASCIRDLYWNAKTRAQERMAYQLLQAIDLPSPYAVP